MFEIWKEACVDAWGFKWGGIFYSVGLYWFLGAVFYIVAGKINSFYDKFLPMPEWIRTLDKKIELNFEGLPGKIILFSGPLAIFLSTWLVVSAENWGIKMAMKDPSDFSFSLNHDGVWFYPDETMEGFIVIEGVVIHGYLEIEGENCMWWHEEGGIPIVQCSLEEPFKLIIDNDGFNFFPIDFRGIKELRFVPPP